MLEEIFLVSNELELPKVLYNDHFIEEKDEKKNQTDKDSICIILMPNK